MRCEASARPLVLVEHSTGGWDLDLPDSKWTMCCVKGAAVPFYISTFPCNFYCFYNCQFDFLIDPKVVSETF